MTTIQRRTHQIQTILLIAAVFVAGFVFGNQSSVIEAQGRIAISDTDEAFAPFWEAYAIIQNNFIDEVEINTLVDGAITGMVDALGDENTLYHDPESYARVNEDISGQFEGIGVTIRLNEESEEIEIINVINNSPAMQAGVRDGDVFIAVNGENVVGLNTSELAELVRGPAGTSVTVTLRRGEELIDFTITRARLEVPDVESEVLDDNIGYIRLSNFYRDSRRKMDEALTAIDVNNRAGLIFDMRGNPGGLLTTAVDIGSAFIREGVILYEAYGDGSEDILEANGNFANITVPVVVLVDESSASASELVAGALQDVGAATIMGEITFGKGTVQQVIPISNGGGVRVTIARWLTPNRNWIHKQGVTPDIVIEWEPTNEPGEIDPQLQTAIDFILGNGN